MTAMGKMAPCHHCEDRHPACHGHCERYIEWCKEREATKPKKNSVMNEYYIERDARFYRRHRHDYRKR